MIKLLSKARRSTSAALLSILFVFYSIGCASTGTTPQGAAAPRNPAPLDNRPDVIRVGDPISIEFSGVSDAPPKIVERLKADGLIHLPLLKEPVKADGKSRSQLEREIHDLYVPKIYRRLTVYVGAEGRFFTVAGEVRMPGRYPFLGDMTILKAIATAGDFTDFANRRRVRVIRGNARPITVNCLDAARDPSKDIPILPDDYIEVPRRLF